VQLHVQLKKWTLNFNLLYLRNHISHVTKIHKICCINTRIQSLKVWLKSVPPWLKYSIFSRGLSFLAHPVHYICIKMTTEITLEIKCLAIQDNNRSTEMIWKGEKFSGKTPFDSDNASCDAIGHSSKLQLQQIIKLFILSIQHDNHYNRHLTGIKLIQKLRLKSYWNSMFL